MEPKDHETEISLAKTWLSESVMNKMPAGWYKGNIPEAILKLKIIIHAANELIKENCSEE